MKHIRYFLEALVLYLFYGLCLLLGLDASSALGGWLGRTIGPHLAASRKALTNLKSALPGKSETDYQQIIKGMWDNLGRVLAEYPHLKKIAQDRVDVIHTETVKQIQDDHQPAILFSAHMGNWEIMSVNALLQFNLEIDVIYRAPNNPWADRLLNQARGLRGKIKTIAKSRSGARQFMTAMKNGRHIGILIDQKYNEGLPVPFFGRPAMTSPAFVQMCQKFDCPLIPVRVERLTGARFCMTIMPPLSTKNIAVTDVIKQAHTQLEEWIRERPEQWLWLHNRWSDKAEDLYQTTTLAEIGNEVVKQDNE